MTDPDVLAAQRAIESIGLDHLCAAHRVVGAVAGVSVGGRRSVVAHGTADQRSGLAVDRDTNFLACSVTKAMTASMVMDLVAAGLVALDDPVVAHVPDFAVADPVASRAVTVRQLLVHTAGFDGDVWPDIGDGPDVVARFVAGMGDLRQLTAPGTRFSYNNAGYVVLGRLVERITGEPWERRLAALADRCGTDIGVGTTPPAGRPMAVGHVRTGRESDPDDAVDPVVGPACMAPAGSRTWTTIDGLLALGEMLNREPVGEAMRSRQVEVGDPNNGDTMGLGVFLDDRWGSPVAFHDGGVNGQAAYLRIVPERGLTMALMSTGGVPQAMHRHVFARMATSFGLRAPHGAVANPTFPVDTDRYVGRYATSATEVTIAPTTSGSSSGLDASISWGHDTDAAIRTPHLPLAAVDARVFLAPLGGRDYVLVFPPLDEPCDDVLAGLRLLPRCRD